MSDSRPRIAIIGTGGIALTHARLIRELGGELVAVCGRTLDRARAFGQAPPYGEPAHMLRETAPDIVHVCSPHQFHAHHSILALEAGAHVLCEKPMATEINDALRMIEAAERAGRVGAVCYTYRGYPVVEILRARIAGGEFGRLWRASGVYLSQDVFASDKYVWMFSPGTTGRSYALMDLGVHWLDLIEYVSGQRIVEMCAQFSTHQPERIWRGRTGEGGEPPGSPTRDGGIEVRHSLEEQADLLIRLNGGAAGCVTVSGVSPGHPNTIVLSLDGSQAGTDWHQQDPNIWIERRPSGNIFHQRTPDALPSTLSWMSKLPAGHAEGYADAFRNVIFQAWSAMRGEMTPYPTFADGLRGLRLVESAVQSAAARHFVAVDA
jgi:predicted dehydrogenase